MFGLKSRSNGEAKKSDERAVDGTDEGRGGLRDERSEHTREDHRARPTEHDQLEYRREEFGGFKGGAVFYGWLISVAMTILLVGIVSAIATGVGSSLDVTKAQAQMQADSIGLSAAIAILVILMIGYFAGGYVAGRLARFNGARQGIGVWVLGLVITVAVVVVGTVFGSQYNIFERVNLPSIPIPDSTLSQGGIITLVAVLVGTLLAAFLGGVVGQRFHARIDRATI